MSKIINLAWAVAVLAPLTVIASEPAPKHEQAEKKAVESADAWLALVDQEKYGDAWESASAFLKNAVTKDDFSKALAGARKPLGKMKSRQIKSKEYRTSLPGAPDGEYVVIQYETQGNRVSAGWFNSCIG